MHCRDAALDTLRLGISIASLMRGNRHVELDGGHATHGV
jgi:hypothetical protein